MSKSFGNDVGLADPPEEQFGRVMSVPDDVLPTWFRLCTDLEPAELDEIEGRLADGSLRADIAKRRLAREIVTMYHGDAAGAAAEERFDQVHRRHELPDDVEDVAIPAEAIKDGTVWIPRLLTTTGLAASNGEARRLIDQGGVRLDGETLADPGAELPADALAGRVLQVGRRRFVRLR
jgi:tyrosyl-tRNA synthetase